MGNDKLRRRLILWFAMHDPDKISAILARLQPEERLQLAQLLTAETAAEAASRRVAEQRRQARVARQLVLAPRVFLDVLNEVAPALPPSLHRAVSDAIRGLQARSNVRDEQSSILGGRRIDEVAGQLWRRFTKIFA